MKPDTADHDLRDGTCLSVGILGPLTIVRDGVKLRARPAAERSVLGLLVLAEGAPVSSASLIDRLWPEKPPATASAVVQTYISRLRQVLGRSTSDGRERLSRDAAGYRLTLGESEVDLGAFRRLLGEARSAYASGDAGNACDYYDRLLRLWRGEPFEDLEAVQGLSALLRVARERDTAILEYAEAAMSVGWHAHVVPKLRELIGREQLDELAHAQLMIALAATGRQGEALNLYEEMRVRLDEQLGIYPGSTLQDAHARILRQEGLATISAQVRRVDTAERTTVRQLPTPVTDFTGRVAESRALIAALKPDAGAPMVSIAVISGPPGVGKTALALHVAHDIRGTYSDAQFYVAMGGHPRSGREPGDALGELLRALGVDRSAIPESLDERAGLFRSLIAERRVLILIDDAVTEEQVRPLLPGTPGSAVIVTARSRMGALAGARFLHLDPLPDEDAIEMLRRVVGDARVASDPAMADRLISACDRLPLALRIAAAKLAIRPSWPMAVVAKAVGNKRHRLDELAIDDLGVRTSINPSYDALNPRERRAFRCLGLLDATDFAGWVVAALIGEDDATAIVDALVDRSLLMSTGTDGVGEPRYRLQDLLRAYAVEKLEDEPENDRAAALVRALTRWFELAMIADHGLQGEPQIPRLGTAERTELPEALVRTIRRHPLAWFDAERLNLIAATRQAYVMGQRALAAELAALTSGLADRSAIREASPAAPSIPRRRTQLVTSLGLPPHVTGGAEQGQRLA